MIETNGYTLLFFPPYSPDLNPIENYKSLFDALRAVFQTI
ncbi:MAG: hypothetical protein HC889_13295 [Synechococcaceae cyanobacterium SM1_2_3]|nr:hypothetical protein [Synechococcaceae cyanobacterium SM1_2_3]